MKRRLRTDTLAPRIAASLIPLTAAFVAALLAGSPRTNAQLPQDRAATGMEEPDAKPAAPSNLAAVATSSTQVDLTWSDNSNNEESFKIGRSTDGVLFFSQETTDPNDTSYSDTTVAASTTYWYRIRAYNSDGYSSYANVVSVTTPPSGGTTAKTPHGLYEIGGGFDNPGISGYRAELKWSTGNPSDGTYDWKRIDGLVDDAVSNHKQIA